VPTGWTRLSTELFPCTGWDSWQHISQCVVRLKIVSRHRKKCTNYFPLQGKDFQVFNPLFRTISHSGWDSQPSQWMVLLSTIPSAEWDRFLTGLASVSLCRRRLRTVPCAVWDFWPSPWARMILLRTSCPPTFLPVWCGPVWYFLSSWYFSVFGVSYVSSRMKAPRMILPMFMILLRSSCPPTFLPAWWAPYDTS
jgi:hypothetical protein